MKRLILLLSFICLASITAYSQTPRCNRNLLAHVYNPKRLVVLNRCIAVTGTIVDASNGDRSDGVRHEKDGDTHGWLKPDAEFERLLNAGNTRDEEGHLVFEIVCKFPVSQKTAKSACRGFQNSIEIPPIGSHVRIVGQYVEEKNHGKWREIHPVTSIKVVP
jgi:hypothetical protein